MRALALALLVAATSALAATPSPEASTRKAQGDARRDAGDNTGALAAYREALQMSPDYVEAWEEIGKLYFGAKSFRESSEAFQRAVEIDGSYANNWFNLALASRRAGDLTRARDAFRKYLLIKPEDADARLRLADVLRALGEREAAIREYQAVVEAADARKVEPALGDRARGAISQLRAEGAAAAAPSIPLPPPPTTGVAAPPPAPAPAPAAPPTPAAPSVVIQPVVQPPPPHPAAAEPAAPPSPALLDKLALGDRLQAAGDYRGALFAYQDAVYLNPRHALSRVKLGRAYWTLRYVGQADEQWAQATQLAPNDPSIARMIEEARSAPRPAAAEAAAAPGSAKAGDPAGQGGGSASPTPGPSAGGGPRVYKFVPEAQAGGPAPYQRPAADGAPGYSIPLPSPAAPAQPAPPQYPQQPAQPQYEQPQNGAYGQPPQYAQPQYPQPQYGQPPAQVPQPPYGQPSYGQAPYGQPGYGQPVPPQPAQVPASVAAAAQRYRAALSLYTQRDYLGAIAELDAAITLDPNLAVAYSARGSAKYGLRKYREAAADYKAALDLDAGRAEPIWGLAECQRMLRDPAAPDTYRRYAASVAGDVNEERRARARRWATELAPSAR